MGMRNFQLFWGWLFVSVLLVFWGARPLLAEEKPQVTDKAEVTDPAAPRAPAETAAEAQQALRAYLQLQEQLHQTLLTIEQSRKDAEAVSKQSADMIGNRLKLIEQALTLQREREAETARNSSRFALTVAGLLGGVGLIVMLLTAWFLMRTARQFSDLTTLATQSSIGPRPLAGFLSDSQLTLRGSGSVEASGGRLLSALERLEKRIYEIEHAALVPQNPPGAGNGDQKAANGHLDDATAAQVALLLGKAQSLLHLDKPEEALVCFDEALALDRHNTEALVKKGAALEKLKRLEDAVVCYDSALAVDDSMTLAYLYKGGVFNQLERFSEALQCYEKALRTQQKVSVN